MNERDLIVGVHSIAEAIICGDRTFYKLYATEEGMDELRKRGGVKKDQLEKVKVVLMASHKLQETGKTLYRELDYNFNRIPSGLLLESSPIEVFDPAWLYSALDKNPKLKILCLDQVTDVHNGAAIMRTAAFYGVDCIVTSAKGNFGMGPSFNRIASGAPEYVKVVRCSSLPKLVTKLQDNGVTCIGFSEHAENEVAKAEFEGGVCLVMGAEDVGISNALKRVVNYQVAFKPFGQIKSLNVSVAAAIAMESFFAFGEKIS